MPKCNHSNLDLARQDKMRRTRAFAHRPETLKGTLLGLDRTRGGNHKEGFAIETTEKVQRVAQISTSIPQFLPVKLQEREKSSKLATLMPH